MSETRALDGRAPRLFELIKALRMARPILIDSVLHGSLSSPTLLLLVRGNLSNTTFDRNFERKTKKKY